MAHYKYVYDGQGNIVRSIDVLGEKEYNYSYEDGRLVRATENDITLSGEIVTEKTVIHTIRYYYNSDGQMTRKVISPTGGTAQVIYYENSEDKTAVKFYAGGQYVTSHSKSDEFGRKVFDELQLGTGFVSRQFSYHTGVSTEEHIENRKLKSSPTTQLVSHIALSDGRTLSYEHDEEERITKVTETFQGENVTVTAYTYDSLGQLLTEKVNGVVVNTMTYDNYGNIVSKNGVAYTYGDEHWKDLLTGYGDKTITYDAQGNPVNYLGHILTWEKGRQLKKFVKIDGTVIDYTYNANGIRTSKTVNGVKHTYTLDGTKILRETWMKDGVNHAIVPMYDNKDSVCGIQYNGEPYYFQKNLQGDIIAIVDKDANTVARYIYDAWGACIIEEDNSGCNIAEVNPYRYRGYYFDTEIEMYYLQSRYYEPFVGKFINGDDMLMFLLSDFMTISSNIYVYCENCVVNKVDYNGFKSTTYKGITCTSSKKGFDVNMHLKFLVKSFCLQYANHVISRWGSKNKYLGMDKTRIAKELFGHAVLFVLGVVVAGYSIASLVNVYTARNLLSKLTGIIVAAASGYVAYYLIDHAKKINVNNDETAFRMTVFNVIWLFF